MKNPFFYLLLAILVILNGWLMSHPNLIGRFGIFFYEYDYLKTFPRALGTVASVVAIALLLNWVAGRFSRPVAIGLTIALLAVSVYWLFQTVVQFNSGVYKLTGAGFRAGGMLLPILVVAVFGKGAWERIIR